MFANFDRKPVQYYHYNPIGENEIEGTQSNFSPFSVSMSEEQMEKKSSRTRMYAVAAVTLGIMSVITLLQFSQVVNPTVQQEFDPVSDVTTPYSTVDPRLLGFQIADRYGNSVPGSIFGDLVNDSTPLPTNAWCQNLLLSDPYNSQANQAFQVPYLVDTAGYIPGLRSHAVRVQAGDLSVMMIYDPDNGLTLGSMEQTSFSHKVVGSHDNAASRLSLVLQWAPLLASGHRVMYSPIVRGSPYSSMVYVGTTPRVYVQRSVQSLSVDQKPAAVTCGVGNGVFSKPFMVNAELSVTFATSDMTWLIFVSEPTEFICSIKQIADPPTSSTVDAVKPREAGWQMAYPYFDLRATGPMAKGMIRVAMANNCTTGLFNSPYCDQGRARNNNEFTQLLRDHVDLYPTDKADISFNFPDDDAAIDDVELRLNFDWAPARMSQITSNPSPGIQTDDDFTGSIGYGSELITYAIPHQQQRLVSTPSSSNEVLGIGCTPTLHGLACPVVGSRWSMVEHLHRVNFSAAQPPRPEMVDDLTASVLEDLDFRIPLNYQHGAGDTYFSGKMLARLSRIIVIADELGLQTNSDGLPNVKFQRAVAHLRAGVEVWLNGSAEAPFLYDRDWGGLVSCGCAYDGQYGICLNVYPNCPAIADVGQNFGNAYYNDHHYHYGYHIYAAAVVMTYDNAWARKFIEHVLLYVRDIANPSPQDPFFPTWRHKDWYLGFSWASGIVNLNLNGRNQESSSEAVAAYESVALLGDVIMKAFSHPTVDDRQRRALGARIKNMGRLLYATELRSAKTYWHVQDASPLVPRIYPSVYTPKVVGMIWSMLAQRQTWFGNAAYLSYGIQLLPLTAASEDRDTPSWVQEMLPIFNQSCAVNKDCENQGWSILVLAEMATLGNWQEAWDGLNRLPAAVYDSAGGNGHSRSNSLWYIATRPAPLFD